jgi:iron complex transport system substrate-binding protein
VLLIIVLIAASVYTAYSMLNTSEPSPSTHAPTSTQSHTPTNITVVDSLGNTVTITRPVTRIVSINYGLTEILCALGYQDLIVGRDELSISPPSVTSIPVVAGSSYTPNMELLLETKPDLIIADGMLRSKTQEIAAIEAAGIPLYIENTGNFSRIIECIINMGRILGKEQIAEELYDFLTYYQTLAATRIADISPNQKPTVYLEWTDTWRTTTHLSIISLMLDAGGINIADGALSASETSHVSPEYVMEANPDIILKIVGGTSYTIDPLQTQYTEMLDRSALSDTNAIKNGRVHTYYNIITQCISYPIGLLYYEKWLYPDLFSDIDPVAVQTELYQRFFGITVEGVYTYP